MTPWPIMLNYSKKRANSQPCVFWADLKIEAKTMLRAMVQTPCKDQKIPGCVAQNFSISNSSSPTNKLITPTKKARPTPANSLP